MKHIKLYVLALLPFLVVGYILLTPGKAHAYNYTNDVMDDNVFTNPYTMSATQILQFLQQEGSGLANFTDVYVCGYPDSTPDFSFYNQAYDCDVAKTDSNGNVYYQTQPQSAALIIAESSQAYGINPQVVLATLEKEQSLVTTPNPTTSQIDFAMGYDCPDSTGCGGISGFFNQIDNATWQFRFDFDSINGENYWGLPPSDYPCNGATRYYSTALKPGNTVTFYDDYGTAYSTINLADTSTSALYCYTPHVFPGSAAEYYSGQYNFVYYFSLWFGSSTAPYAFEAQGGSTIYFYINGNKVAVNAMGIVQDYGVSPQSINVLPASTVNAIPTPTDGTSTSLNYLVEAPGSSTVYLVTLDKLYQFQSTAQLTAFGFNSSDVSVEPASFIDSIPSGGTVSNYISSPYGSVFEVSGGQKQLVYTYQTYISLNPGDQITPVSYFFADQLATGSPISNQPILVQYPNSQAVYLFLNGNYYQVPTMDVLNCWGFQGSGPLATSTYTLPESDYVPAIVSSYPLSCLVQNSSGNVDLMGKTVRYSPVGYGVTKSQADDSDIVTLSQELPAVSTPQQYIKTNTSAAVWYLSNGERTVVPTYSDFLLLGLNAGNVTTIDSSAISSIPASSGVQLGTGQIVKSSSSSAVYAISGNSRILYPTSASFMAYGNNWSNIETYPEATLDQEYPYSGVTVGTYFYSQAANTVYLVDPNGCYALNQSLLSAFGQSQSQITNNQTYTASIFPNLNLTSCVNGSVYVQEAGSPAVYLMNNGQLQPFASWNALVNYSQSADPRIITLSPNTISTFSFGSPIQ